MKKVTNLKSVFGAKSKDKNPFNEKWVDKQVLSSSKLNAFKESVYMKTVWSIVW